MISFDPVQQYFDAWNRHDPAAIVACFTADGSYRDPVVPEGIAGDALANYTGGFFAALPDVRFDIVSRAGHDGRVVVEWLMVAGPAVALPGMDFIDVEGDRLRSVRGYFDRKTFDQQSSEDTQSGEDNWSYRVTTSKPTPPGAFSLTWIDFRPEDIEREQVEQFGGRTGMELMPMPGVITWLTAAAGRRWFTATAWEDVESVHNAMKVNTPHKEAMRQFFQGDFGQAVHTGIWTPHRLGAVWVRCSSCGQVSDYHRAGGRCPCGEALMPQPPYW